MWHTTQTQVFDEMGCCASKKSVAPNPGAVAFAAAPGSASPIEEMKKALQALEAAAGRALAAQKAFIEATPSQKHTAAYAASYDGGESWCLRGNSADKLSAERLPLEMECLKLTMQLDAVCMPNEAEKHAAMVSRGVQVKWLREFLLNEVPKDERSTMTTAQVVEKCVLPGTESTRARYCELPGVAKGNAKTFCSHTWGAPFADLVAAICHVMEDDDFVWVDIFAVRQWPGNALDVDFAPVVANCDNFLLSAMHIQELADIDGEWGAIYELRKLKGSEELMMQKLPTMFSTCAFFRIWCIAELTAAVIGEKNVVMMVGAATFESSEGKVLLDYEPETDMLAGLVELIDIRKAKATFECDRNYILDLVEKQTGLEAVNTLCYGAVCGAGEILRKQDLLKASVGNFGPLKESLKDGTQEAKNAALYSAAAAGCLPAVNLLLDMGASIHSDAQGAEQDNGYSVGLATANAGHLKVIKRLVEAGLDKDLSIDGTTMLHCCVEGGHNELASYLLELGVDIQAKDADERSPLHYATMNGHRRTIDRLLKHGANIEAEDALGATALTFAVGCGHLDCLEALLEQGAKFDEPGKAKKRLLLEALSYSTHATDQIKAMLIKHGVNEEEIQPASPAQSSSSCGDGRSGCSDDDDEAEAEAEAAVAGA